MRQASIPALLLTLSIGGNAFAAPSPNPFGEGAVALADTTLAGVRGGFAGDGLAISFGIERAVFVNGSLMTSTRFSVIDLGRITGGRGASVVDAGAMTVIQNGVGNAVASGATSPNSMGAIVQNTLDGQKIQNVTTINATANSVGIYRSLNLGSSLRGAVIDSLRR